METLKRPAFTAGWVARSVAADFPREKQPGFPMGEIPLAQYSCKKMKPEMSGSCDVTVVAGLSLGKGVEFAMETKFQARTINPFLRSRAHKASAYIWFYCCK